MRAHQQQNLMMLHDSATQYEEFQWIRDRYKIKYHSDCSRKKLQQIYQVGNQNSLMLGRNYCLQNKTK